MDVETQQLAEIPEENNKSARSSLVQTIISLAVFILADYMLTHSWKAVALLAGVIFIHEMGHYIAMKAFGYKAVKMVFVPFVGAYVSGEVTDFSRQKKMIMLLAGPVPGIIIGCILLALYQNNYDHTYLWAAITFLALNLFNMLPVSPLDGGQFFETLFFHGNRILQLVFLYASLAVLIYFAIHFNQWFFWVIGFMLLLRITHLHNLHKVRKALDAKGINYRCSYDDLTDEQYWQIRDTLVEENKVFAKKYTAGSHSENETELINPVKRILMPYYDNVLSVKLKLIFLSIWLLAVAFPILQWLLFKK